MPELHHFEVAQNARYATIGAPGPKTKRVWIVCHGYGQLAQYFIRPFEEIADEETLIVAPEAMHRFYLQGVGGGRVGASWMTKEDRLNDIRNYVHYLDTFLDSILKDLDRNKITMTVLGFSQGGATVSRWMAQGRHKADQLVLWASAFPPDLDLEVDRETLSKMQVVVLAGDQDEYLQEGRLEEQKQFLDQTGIAYRYWPYEGRHAIDREVLKELATHLGAPISPTTD